MGDIEGLLDKVTELNLDENKTLMNNLTKGELTTQPGIKFPKLNIT